MKYADYYDCDICNGISVGMSLFISGCPFHCQGCFNPEAWSFEYGNDWTKEVEDKFLKLIGRKYIKRVSFLGGSPLCDQNIGDVGLLIQKIKDKYPNKQIWVYTGYTWESIIKNQNKYQILHYIDVLVDGQFEYKKKNLTIAFRGSSNQRIIDVQKSLSSGEIILWNQKELSLDQ